MPCYKAKPLQASAEQKKGQAIKAQPQVVHLGRRVLISYVKALMLDHYEIHFNTGETAFKADYCVLLMNLPNSSVTSLISPL